MIMSDLTVTHLQVLKYFLEISKSRTVTRAHMVHAMHQ